MPDLYDWVLSAEIREHLRANHPLSTAEKVQHVCGGFRSIEEKEAALRALLEEAEPGELREKLGTLVRLYGLAIEELGESGPECLFVLPVSRSRPGKTNTLILCDACLYSSCAGLLEHAEGGPHLCASKWERVNERWEKVIDFDVQQVNGTHCATRFWPSGGKEAEWGIDMDALSFALGLGDGRVCCPIPFMTGDLVKLDAPVLDGPLFGVMDNVLDLNGTRYMWLGYVEGDHLNVMTLSYDLLGHSGGYRVIDWLHSARPEELPEDERILLEISEYLRRQPRRDGVGSDVDNEFLEIFQVRDGRMFRRRAEMPFSELLARIREERGGPG